MNFTDTISNENLPNVLPEAFLDFLKLLLNEPAVVGFERPFFRVLRREAESMGVKVETYEGLLVINGDSSRSDILCAHVDRHGLVSTGPQEFQYAAYTRWNRTDDNFSSLSESFLRKVEGRFIGKKAKAYEPWNGSYLGQGTIEKCEWRPYHDNIFFEIPELSNLPPGVPIAYVNELEMSGDMMSAQLDNVLSVAVALYLLKTGWDGTMLFSAQEEVGRSWRYLVEWFHRNPDRKSDVMVLDTSPYPDEEALLKRDIVLRNCDAYGNFDPKCVARLSSVCESNGISFSYKDEDVTGWNEVRVTEGKKPTSIGRTELGRLVSASDGAINGATVQVPTLGYHTASESVRVSAVIAMLRVLQDCLGSS